MHALRLLKCKYSGFSLPVNGAAAFALWRATGAPLHALVVKACPVHVHQGRRLATARTSYEHKETGEAAAPPEQAKDERGTSADDKVAMMEGMPYKFVQPESASDVASASPQYRVTSLNINRLTLDILKRRDIDALYAFQGETIKAILEGKDVLARARTGTGKTLAFVLPVIEKLLADKQQRRTKLPRVLVLTPTRELSIQVANEFRIYIGGNGESGGYTYDDNEGSSMLDRLSIVNCYGGGGNTIQSQSQMIRAGVDIVVGTPGRLLDLIERQVLSLASIHTLVIDEADHMLDLGFKDSIEGILRHIPKTTPAAEQTSTLPYQTCLFSATVKPWVVQMAQQYFQRDRHTMRIFIDAVGQSKLKAGENITHVAVPFHMKKNADMELAVFLKALLRNMTRGDEMAKCIVFCDTKRQVDMLGQLLLVEEEDSDNGADAGSSPSGASGLSVGLLHGDVSQSMRERVLRSFKSGRLNTILATDVAARGLDIANIHHVVQIGPPKDTEYFIHRSGRTARAGKLGLNWVLFDPAVHGSMLKELEREAGVHFIVKNAIQAEDMCKDDGLMASLFKTPLALWQSLQQRVTEAQRLAVLPYVDTFMRAVKEHGASAGKRDKHDTDAALVAVLPNLLALLDPLNRAYTSTPAADSSVSAKRSLVTGELGWATFVWYLNAPAPSSTPGSSMAAGCDIWSALGVKKAAAPSSPSAALNEKLIQYILSRAKFIKDKTEVGVCRMLTQTVSSAPSASATVFVFDVKERHGPTLQLMAASSEDFYDFGELKMAASLPEIILLPPQASSLSPRHRQGHARPMSYDGDGDGEGGDQYRRRSSHHYPQPENDGHRERRRPFRSFYDSRAHRSYDRNNDDSPRHSHGPFSPGGMSSRYFGGGSER